MTANPKITLPTTREMSIRVPGGVAPMTPGAAGASSATPQQTVGSLCSGYGGLDLGLALALGVPLRHAWHVENDPAPSKILAARFPGTPNYGDIKLLPYADMEPVDLLTAGYPCQPFSDAGLRLGEADERHLWPYVADTIGTLRPRGVLLENVRGHVRRGLPTVLADLAALRYDARWLVVPASRAGAAHLRERVFIVAEDADRAVGGERWLAAPGQAQGGRSRADAGGRSGTSAPNPAGDGRHEGRTEPAGQLGRPDAAEPCSEVAADPHSAGLEGRESAPGPDLPAWGLYEPAIRRWEAVIGRPAPWATEPRGRGGAHRLSPRFVEWLMGLPDGWVTAVDGLTVNDQLKALGNGVVPQQAALAVRVLLGLPSAGVVAA